MGAKRLINALLNAVSHAIPQSLSDSKSGSLRGVWVRVPPPALREIPAKRDKISDLYGSPATSVGGRGSSRLIESALKRFGCLALHIGKHVRVSIERYGDARVTEHFGAYLGVYVPTQWPPLDPHPSRFGCLFASSPWAAFKIVFAYPRIYSL